MVLRPGKSRRWRTRCADLSSAQGRVAWGRGLRGDRLLAASATIIFTPTAHAQRFWDGNNGAANFGSLNASSTWAVPTAGTATNGWTTDATGATAISGNSITTTTVDALNFGTGTTNRGLGGSTLTVSGTVDALSLAFGSQTTNSLLFTGGMSGIDVYGMKAAGTKFGFRIKSAKVRGGTIRDVFVHDMEMDGVANPFHWELNWYPAYSYPPRPETIPEAEWPAHWHLLLTPVTPPELGIPSVRDIRISNVRVTNADLGLFASAYPEKPIRNVVFENVSIEAKSGGSLDHGQDWTIHHVGLRSKSQLSLKNCKNVDFQNSIHESPHCQMDPRPSVFSVNCDRSG